MKHVIGTVLLLSTMAASVAHASIYTGTAGVVDNFLLNDGDIARNIGAEDTVAFNIALSALDSLYSASLQFDDDGWTATVSGSPVDLYITSSSGPDLTGLTGGLVPNNGVAAGGTVSFGLNPGTVDTYINIGYVLNAANNAVIDSIGGQLSFLNNIPSNGGPSLVNGFAGAPVSAVPVPAAFPLMACALGMFGIARRRKAA